MEKESIQRFNDAIDKIGNYLIMNREQITLWDYRDFNK